MSRRTSCDHSEWDRSQERSVSSVALDTTAELCSIAYVGRLSRQKRLETLLEAVSICAGSLGGRLNLKIAGDGEERATLMEMVRKQGLELQVSLLGHVPDPMGSVLPTSSCFVNPSESEGLPNAVLEALAVGVPVVLSDIPVHREIAAAVGMEDFLFPVGDARALAQVLTFFFNMPLHERRQFGKRCWEYAQRFSATARDEAYLRLCQDLLREHRV